jgi:hypothetical protein
MVSPHQEGTGDLGHGQTADHAQRERHAVSIASAG